MIEPSGTTFQYFACAAGKGRQPVKTEMEKLAPAKLGLSVREGVKELAKMVYGVQDEAKDKPFELEMSWVCKESDWKHVGVPKDILKESVDAAKRELEEEEDEDEEEMEE
mmetsp:Transcript_6897/g.8570  ORF Transcript_6897/g.8570 Transcript_6897/m.8570 type:complete len:110 (+) Transcript_6897:32-361(+)